MERLTGKQVKSLVEAYAQVYTRPEELNEAFRDKIQARKDAVAQGPVKPATQQAQPAKTNLQGLSIGPRGFQISPVAGKMTDAEFDRKYAGIINAPRAANDREGLGPRQQVQPPQRTGAPAAQTVAATGGAGGRVTVGKSYAATLGNQKGSVTYDAQGNRKFTPATQPAAAAAPAVGGSPAPAKTTAPSGTTTTATTAPAAPAKPANPLMKDMPGQNRAELEKLRADAAMKSIGQSPRAKQILGGTARSAAANQIGRQTLNRSINADIQQANRPEVLNRPAPAASSPTNNTATAFAPGTNLAPGANKISSTPVSKLKSDAQNKKTVMNSVDLFDIVKGHLMSEGATEEEAMRLMVIMPQEEVESIVELNLSGLVNLGGKILSKVKGKNVERAVNTLAKPLAKKAGEVVDYARNKVNGMPPFPKIEFDSPIRSRAQDVVRSQKLGFSGTADELNQLQQSAQQSINRLTNPPSVTSRSADLNAKALESQVRRAANYGPSQYPPAGFTSGRRIDPPAPTGSKPKGKKLS